MIDPLFSPTSLALTVESLRAAIQHQKNVAEALVESQQASAESLSSSVDADAVTESRGRAVNVVT